MTAQADIDTLNALMRQLGYRTTYTLAKGGWFHQHIPETGNRVAHRIGKLPAMVEARRTQFARLPRSAR